MRCRDLNDGEGDRRSSTTTVTVNIVDQNDNEPQMVQTFFSVATRYDAEYRTFLARLQATDADSGTTFQQPFIAYATLSQSTMFLVNNSELS